MKFSLLALLTVINFELLAVGADSLSSQPNFLRKLAECGNGNCEEGEDCNTCPDDCISSSTKCGNDICEVGENCETCPEDCNGEDVDEQQGLYCCYGGSDEPDTDENGAVSCSDARCGASAGRCNFSNTVEYCCGDGVCQEGETMANCPIDGCTCGDGECDVGENTHNCPEDCKCNNNRQCDIFETVDECPLDCHCGDGICQIDAGETVANCDDCTCNRNGVCEQHEDPIHCPDECGLDGEDSILVVDGEIEESDEVPPGEDCLGNGVSCDNDSECCTSACLNNKCVG